MNIERIAGRSLCKVLAATVLLSVLVTGPSCLFVEAIVPGDQSEWFADVGDGTDDGGNDLGATNGSVSTSREILQMLEMLDRAGGGDGATELDLSDMEQYVFVLRQLESASQTPDRRPDLFRLLSQARHDQIRGASNNGSSAASNAAFNVQFPQFEFDPNDPTHLVAVVRVSAPFAEMVAVTVDLFDVDRQQLIAVQSSTAYNLGSGSYGTVSIPIDANGVTSQGASLLVTCTVMWSDRGPLDCYAASKYLFR